MADFRIFTSSHTCLPVLQPLADGADRACVIANNGAAGTPNFYNTQTSILTRIALRPCTSGLSLYGTRLEGVYVDAVAIPYDQARWQAQFLVQWPPGSDAHASYWARISNGPDYMPERAVRGGNLCPEQSGTAR